MRSKCFGALNYVSGLWWTGYFGLGNIHTSSAQESDRLFFFNFINFKCSSIPLYCISHMNVLY